MKLTDQASNHSLHPQVNLASQRTGDTSHGGHLRPRSVLMWVAAAAIVTALVVLVVVQQRSIAALKIAHAQLAQNVDTELVPISPNDIQGNIDAEELARLRAEHGELIRLRGEVTLLRNQVRELTASRANTNAALLNSTALDPSAAPFAKVTTNHIPGRYSVIDLDTSGAVTKNQVIQLNPDGSFLTFWRADGQPSASSAYRWLLHPQGLVLTWQKGISLFHQAPAPGVYVSVQPDNSQLRLEKIQSVVDGKLD